MRSRLPTPLALLSNTPGRAATYLSCPAPFSYRADEWAAQATTGAVRYDISYDPERGRWYLDASWTFTPSDPPTIEALSRHNVLAVDLNDGFLACWVVAPDGNPLGRKHTIRVDLEGSASHRDGRLRATVTEIVGTANTHDCSAIVIENLDFDGARTTGRETMGRGKRGKRFRRIVAGIPTARFRDRLSCMAANKGLWIIAVDPGYSSIWGGQHWQRPLDQSHNKKTSGNGAVSRHHAAAVVLGRRAIGYRARRRTGDPNRDQRITDGKVPSRPDTTPKTHTGQETGKDPPERNRSRNTGQSNPTPPSPQGSQNRPGSPTKQDSLLHGV